MIFQLAFKYAHRGAQLYISRQVVPNINRRIETDDY